MSDPLRILLIDDDQDDYLLTREVLTESMRSSFELDWVSSYDEGLDAIKGCKFDVCLLDYRLGKRSGLDLLRDPVAVACNAPIILLTGQNDRDVDLEAMRAGAADYLQKDSIASTLERTIRYAIERFLDRAALRQLNEILERRVEERTAELEKANAALKEADRRKDEFIAILAHELRNPLAPISNSLALLKHAEHEIDVCREARQTMERQLEHMVRLIDDLLEVSRVSRGKIELRKTNVELADVIRQAVEAAMPFVRDRRQQLHVDVPKQPITLQADPTRLAQVVGNLLHNASKFTPVEGEISLRVEDHRHEARILVKDSGIGIDPQHLPTIFDMFTQLDSSLERSQGGLGIGLTLVRSLVELHDGTVEAFSEGHDRGSEFVVRLPIERSSNVAAASPDEVEVNASGRRRILVVDDNVDAANTLSLLLRFDKHEVRCAYDGEQALAAVAEFKPEILLLDIGLPKINGYEVARMIRANHAETVPLLVAMTGWGQEEDRQKSREAGFNYHLVKPVERSSLLKLFAELPTPSSVDGSLETPRS